MSISVSALGARRRIGYNAAVSEPNLTNPILISEQPALHRLAAQLSKEPILAVDTESNSLFAYREQLCLIQFSTRNQDYLVDPLSLTDLSPLYRIFSNPKIEKVFHAAEYDLIVLKRDYGVQVRNLFDTMIAARILGRKAVGLASILRDEFGVHLQKRFQRANWGKRPIPADLLAYAQLDTHYLIPLRDRLKAALESAGLWELAVEDFARACDVPDVSSEPSAGEPWRIQGAYDLTSRQAAVLQELCLYRRRQAEALDRPLFKVIQDQTLMAIARALPRTEADLRAVPGMTPRLIRPHGSGLLHAVSRGLQAPPLEPPRTPRPDNGFLQRYDALREWRKSRARSLGVESDIVLPRDVMAEIARAAPGNREELQRILSDLPWRMQHFSREILEVLSRIPQSQGNPS